MPSNYFLTRKVIKCTDTGEKCIGYKEYLKSNHWKALRAQFINDNSVCEICHERNSPLQLHHKDYTNLGRENRNDLMILCETCHKAVHQVKDDLKDNGLDKPELSKLFIDTKKERKKSKKKNRPKCIGVDRTKGGRVRNVFFNDYNSKSNNKFKNIGKMKERFWPDTYKGSIYIDYNMVIDNHTPIPRYDCIHQRACFFERKGTAQEKTKHYFTYCNTGRKNCKREQCKCYKSLLAGGITKPLE